MVRHVLVYHHALGRHCDPARKATRCADLNPEGMPPKRSRPVRVAPPVEVRGAAVTVAVDGDVQANPVAGDWDVSDDVLLVGSAYLR